MLTNVSVKADCGHHERKRHVEDGECRDCRGVEKLERLTPVGERPAPSHPTDEYAAHDADTNRSHVVNNDRTDQ